jgi:Ca2+-binding RTX toxin-like protein
LSAVKLTSLTVTGSNALDAGSVDSEVLATVNASAHTGATFSVNASASNVAMTITGSSGSPVAADDIVNTLTGGSKADTITGGASRDSIAGGNGADSISAGAGNDSIDGGSGADIIDAGEGNNSVLGGAGDDSITAGAGNDLIDSGSGDDTVNAGGGNDMLIESSLTDDTSIDGGTGTDRLSAVDSTGTTFNSTAASLVTGFVAVTDDAAPALPNIETAYVSITATASTDSDDPVNLDLTNATALTTLYLKVDAGNGDFAKVTNYKGASLTLFGAATDIGAEEADELTIDGAGQASLTVNLENYIGATGDEDITVTGVSAFTLAGKSKSMFTGTAAQDNTIDDLTADTASTLTISSSGSSTTTAGAGALTIDAVSASQANTVNVTAGSADTVTITSITTAGNEVENATVTVSADAILDIDALAFGTSAMDTLTLTVNDAGTLSSSTSNDVITAEMVDVTADSIGTLTVTLAAGSTEASLDLSAIEVSAGTFSLASGSTLVLKNSLGATDDDSSFVFSGRGDLDFDTGSAVNNTVTLAGSSVVFDASALTVDADAITVTATSGADTVRTGLGNDVITGGDGNDVLSGGAGKDTYVFAATGAANDKDTISTFTPGATTGDVFNFDAYLPDTGSIVISTTPATAAALATQGTSIAVSDDILLGKVTATSAIDTVDELVLPLLMVVSWMRLTVQFLPTTS